MNQKIELQIDYGKHPAFINHLPPHPAGTGALDHVFAEIDTNLRLIRNTSELLSTQFIRSYFRKQIDPIFTELREGVLSLLNPTSWYYPMIPGVIRDARNALQSEVMYHNENKSYQGLDIGQGGFGPSFKDNGCVLLKLPKEEVAKIWAELQPYRSKVDEVRQKTPWEVSAVALPHEGRYWELTVDLLRRAGVFAALTHAHNCPMDLLHVSFACSSTDEIWYKNCYQDVGLPTSRTAYMHFDHSYDVVKMMIYLTDVTAENGPFSVIPKSRDFIKSYTQAVLWKWMDWHADVKAHTDPRFESRYRRKRYLFPELRKELMALPNQLRATSHFGEDLIDGSPLSNALLEHEVVCTSDVANAVLFDGAYTIHRGGLVEKGERWAFQLGFARTKTN